MRRSIARMFSLLSLRLLIERFDCLGIIKKARHRRAFLFAASFDMLIKGTLNKDGFVVPAFAG